MLLLLKCRTGQKDVICFSYSNVLYYTRSSLVHHKLWHLRESCPYTAGLGGKPFAPYRSRKGTSSIYCLLIFCTSWRGCRCGVGDQFGGAGPDKSLFVAHPPSGRRCGRKTWYRSGKRCGVDKVLHISTATVHTCWVPADVGLQTSTVM